MTGRNVLDNTALQTQYLRKELQQKVDYGRSLSDGSGKVCYTPTITIERRSERYLMIN